jgi:hypothetical protein
VTVSEPSERDRGASASARIAPENKRANVGDLTVAVSSLVLVIGIFLPWFEFGDPATGYYSFSAADLRTWMYVPVFVSVAVVGSVVAKAMRTTSTRTQSRGPRLLSLGLVGACGADLVLTLGCFVKRSPGLSWDYGAYLSVVVAVAALAGALMSTVAAWGLPGRSGARGKTGPAAS